MIIEPIVYQKFNGRAEIIINDGTTFSYNDFLKSFSNSNFNSAQYSRATAENLQLLVSNTSLNNFTKPFLIFADGFDIPQFSKLVYSKEIIEFLNQEGLCIFLTELLIKYKGPRQFISKADNLKEKLDSFNFSNARFETTVDSDIRSFQLDSINDLIVNNNLHNVTVYTIEDNVSVYFLKRYPRIKFVCKDIFLENHTRFFIDSACNAVNIKNKFLCTNWRYSPIRHLVMSFLINIDGKYSWFFKGTIDNLQKGLHFDLVTFKQHILIKQGIEKLNLLSPLNLDSTINIPLEISGKLSDILLWPEEKIPNNIDKNIYEDVFCVIVNECEFTEPTANFSEKTLLAIKNKRPFIIVGQPKSLAYLKKYGFKTFDDFWDETYDAELNHKTRLEKIFSLIQYINEYSLEDLIVMYSKMLPIIDHNFKVLSQLSKSKWPEFI